MTLVKQRSRTLLLNSVDPCFNNKRKTDKLLRLVRFFCANNPGAEDEDLGFRVLFGSWDLRFGAFIIYR